MALGPPIVGMPHPAMAGPASVVQARWAKLTFWPPFGPDIKIPVGAEAVGGGEAEGGFWWWGRGLGQQGCITGRKKFPRRCFLIHLMHYFTFTYCVLVSYGTVTHLGYNHRSEVTQFISSQATLAPWFHNRCADPPPKFTTFTDNTHRHKQRDRSPRSIPDIWQSVRLCFSQAKKKSNAPANLHRLSPAFADSAEPRLSMHDT